MRVFLVRLMFFALPIVVLLVCAVLMLRHSSEAWTLPEVLEAERRIAAGGGETLFNRSYVPEEMRRYKWAGIALRHPLIAIVGSSTSMQFRASMFGPYEERVYNAGGLTNSTHELAELARALQTLNELPRVLILGIDHWWLNPAWRPAAGQPLDRLSSSPPIRLELTAWLYGIRKLANQIHRLPWAALLTAPPDEGSLLAIGIGARAGNGFRGSDGSRRYADVVARGEERGRFVDPAATIDRIRSADRRFEEAASVDQRRLEELDQFLKTMKSRGVVVAGYTPPHEPSVFAAWAMSARHAGFIRDYRASVRRVFAANEQPLVDALDVSELGLGADNMVDGFHGSEIVAATILSRLLERSVLAAVLPELRSADVAVRAEGSLSPVAVVPDPWR